jgi:flavodoxin/ferredoxin
MSPSFRETSSQICKTPNTDSERYKINQLTRVRFDFLMDVTLIYFSQTGNTRKVAKVMDLALRDVGHKVRTISFENISPADVSVCDLLGVGTPCHSSQAPTPIKKFLNALPPLKDQRAFVFATSSGAPGKVLYELTCLLRDRGAHVLDGFLARGEVHHPAPHMNGQFPRRPNEADLARARKFALAIAEHVAAGCTGHYVESRVDSLKPGWGFYDFVGLTTSDRMLRRLMPEPKPIPSKCDQCRLCVCQCPLDNITLNSYPILGDRCIRCYHCLTVCPQEAFEVDWRFADPFLQLLYNRHFMRWFGDLKPGEQIY